MLFVQLINNHCFHASSCDPHFLILNSIFVKVWHTCCSQNCHTIFRPASFAQFTASWELSHMLTIKRSLHKTYFSKVKGIFECWCSTSTTRKETGCIKKGISHLALLSFIWQHMDHRSWSSTRTKQIKFVYCFKGSLQGGKWINQWTFKKGLIIGQSYSSYV